MCGIAGIVSSSRLDLSNLFDMTLVQKHRGPDDSGHLFFDGQSVSPVVNTAAQLGRAPIGQVALGHRRLAIVDCSPAGRQPMSYGNGRYWITYNGEVYNYVELRNELELAGCTFVSGSDTEVILAAYATWGEACFARFNGMWALAILDTEMRQILLARDRFGVKPMHYCSRDGLLVFASEIKGVLAFPQIPARLNHGVALDYFTHEVVNRGTETFLRDIVCLPPGHLALVSLDRPEHIVAREFWRLTPVRDKLDFDSACGRFREILESSVALRMRSDVPVGSCLSGGLDSSAIVCLMARLFPQTQVQTFTAGFDDPRFDESHWATMVSSDIGAKPHRSTPSEQTFLDDLDSLIWHQDEPFFSASVYAQWCVMRSARQAGVPVLLDGQGADEALLGYKKFYFFYLRNLIAKGRLLKAGAELSAMAIRGDRGALRWREALRYMPKALRPKNSSLADFLTPTAASARAVRPLQLGSGGDMEQRQIDDLTIFSVPSLLRYEDRNSMAWSIESRVPFLDYRLAEFLVGLPTDFKLREGKTKSVMRAAMVGTIPAAVLNRRDKMGFVTPQSIWMAGKLGERMIGEIAQSSMLANFIDTKAIVTDWNRADASRRNTIQGSVFRAGLFAIWAKRFQVSIQ